jgi:diguanylate cyclase (GGDEF)-like protein/PAS domain S-box-containing protein
MPSLVLRRLLARVSGLSLRARLMLLVVALATPFLLYMGALALTQAQEERAEALEHVELLAGLLAGRVDDFVDDTDQFLRLVARMAGEARPDGMQRFVDGLRGDLRSYLGDVTVWTVRGAPLAALDPQTLHAPYDVASRAAFREALSTGALGFEAPVVLRPGTEPVVLAARGVVDARGQLVAVVTATVRLRQLERVLDPSHTLPADAVVTLLDANGVVVARSREPDKWIGRNMSDAFDRARFERSHGSSEITGFDGVARMSGFAVPTRAPWKVYVGIPTESALVHLARQLRTILLLGGAALIAGLLLAAIAANGITRRLRALAEDAAQLEAGALDHRSSVRGGDEVGVLGEALNRMAERFEQRERELTRRTEELALVTANVPVLIAYIDAQQRFRFANEYHRDVFGVPPEKLIGRRMRELFTPGSYARLAPHIAEVLSGLPVSFETTFDARGTGPCFLVSCFPDYGDDNAVRGFYAVCQDITRRREAESTLAARERFIQTITETVPARITYLDTEGRVQFGNRAFRAAWGVTDDYVGRPLRDFVPAPVYAQIAPRLERGVAGEKLSYELTSADASGTRHDIVHYVPDVDAEGRVHGVFTISQDVTALKRIESLRAESEQRIRTITDKMPAAMAYLNRHERYLFANQAFLAAFGTTLEDLVGQRVADILPPDEYAATRSHIEAVLRGERQRFQRVGKRLGIEQHELVDYLPERDASGEVTGFFAVISNITDLHDAQVRVEQSEQRLRRITGNVPALICYIDLEWRYRFNSRFYEEWLGRPLTEITGRTVLEVLGPDTCAVDAPYLRRAFAGEHVDFELQHTDGHGTRWVRGSYVPDFDADGRVIGIYGVTTDITPLKQVERELARLAQFDSLTGLANRNRFDVVMGEALARARRAGQGVGLLFLDIDAFKQINDTHGHAAGDEVLQEFARRVVALVRETDTVARLAGDEFIVLLENVQKHEECRVVARKICTAMRTPFELSVGQVAVTTSIGIAMSADAAMAGAALLHRADTALYSAKAQGRDRYEVAI